MDKFFTLHELTDGCESGIVIFGDFEKETAITGIASGEIIIGNWMRVDGIPRVDPAEVGLVGLGEEMEIVYTGALTDIGMYLKVGVASGNAELVFDQNDDFDGLRGVKGKMYIVKANGTKFEVITPEGWN